MSEILRCKVCGVYYHRLHKHAAVACSKTQEIIAKVMNGELPAEGSMDLYSIEERA